MAVEKYLNPNYTEGGSEPKYISLPNLTVEGGDVDLSNYLAKDNTEEFTPTGDYNPCTKKYVDDQAALVANNYLSKENTTEYTPTADYNPATKKYVDDTVDNKFKGIGCTFQFDRNLTAIEKQGYDFTNSIKLDFSVKKKDGSSYYSFGHNIIPPLVGVNSNSINYTVQDFNFVHGIISDASLNEEFVIYKFTVTCYIASSTIKCTAEKLQQVLTETEYSALGTTPETDNVLYFVTPD